jgi:hypothetical protein
MNRPRIYNSPLVGFIQTWRRTTVYLQANLYPDSSPLGPAINLSHQLGLGWDSQPAEAITWKNRAMPAGFSSLLKFDRTNIEKSSFFSLASIDFGMRRPRAFLFASQWSTTLAAF